MNDAISREQAIDALKQQADTMRRWSERYAEQRKGVLTAVNIVEDLPPIQPEIVRCEECLYRKICSWEKQGAKFCSFAERREETT